jgi:hypothetical protein
MKSFVYDKSQPARSSTINTSGAGKSMPAVAIQKKGGPEEELPLQGKFPIQKVGGPEEELPVQGKFPIQKVGGPEEELPVQGKFPIQKVGGPEEELPVQGKFITQKKSGIEEEEPLQGKFAIQKKDGPDEEPLQMKTAQLATEEELPVQKKKNDTGLPDNLKSGIENLSGLSMNDVKVHYNSSKPAQLQALAYAQGTDIHVAPGQEQHLPHEAWHVAQQKQGRVQPTMQMKEGIAVNDDKGLESEADVMGAKAMQMKRDQDIYSNGHSRALSNKIIQPKWIPGGKENILKWDAFIGGKEWYYNSITDMQFYVDKDGPSEELKYIDWLKMGFQGLKDKDLKKDKEKDSLGIDARDETKEEHFLKLRNEGIALYQSISPGGGSDTNDETWIREYEKSTQIDDDTSDEVNIHTGWKVNYSDRISKHNALGRYHNQFDLITGKIKAIDNHRDPLEPLNNNEIIYKQLTMACKKYGTDLKIKSLLRKNIINSTLEPMLRDLKGKNICTPNDALFYVLLTTPNIKVAIHMINDRGLLLNVRTISHMVVEGKNVSIYFA